MYMAAWLISKSSMLLLLLNIDEEASEHIVQMPSDMTSTFFLKIH